MKYTFIEYKPNFIDVESERNRYSLSSYSDFLECEIVKKFFDDQSFKGFFYSPETTKEKTIYAVLVQMDNKKFVIGKLDKIFTEIPEMIKDTE